MSLPPAKGKRATQSNIMNYELAKELKNAGFPSASGYGGYLVGRNILTSHEVRTLPDGTEIYAIPTLEELIEACGEGYGAMDVSRYSNQPTIFIAGAWINRDGEIEAPKGEGATPTEAVARLWISINKKT